MVKTLKDIMPKKVLVPKAWCIHACEDNTVHYLISKKGKLKWVEDREFDDGEHNASMVVFDDRKQARDMIMAFIRSKDFPKEVNNFEGSAIIPTLRGKLYYYDYVSEGREKATFFEVKVK